MAAIAFPSRPSQYRRSLSASPHSPLTVPVILPARYLQEFHHATQVLSPGMEPSSTRYVPRAPLPAKGVTSRSVTSCITSEGITLPLSLLRAHAPDQIPPVDFSSPTTTGLCRLLPVPAGRWPLSGRNTARFRSDSHRMCVNCRKRQVLL